MRTFNKSVSTSLVIDTGLLLEYLSGSPAGKIVDEMIFNNNYIASVLTCPLTLVEVYYLVRRKSNKERAQEEVKKIKKLVSILPIDNYLELLGEIKAITAFSLTDAANIALAEYKSISCVFKHEQEIDKKLALSKSTPFTSRIVFIDDFSYFKNQFQ
ncbi:MAG: PIN domain-containing protein [Candidatus Hodarchaeales archaeon]